MRIELIDLDLATKPDKSAITFNGIPVHVTDLATERHFFFKDTPYRSKRLHKKLLKRYGRQWEMRPCAYIMNIGGREQWHIHPVVLTEIEKQWQRDSNTLWEAFKAEGFV